MIISLSLGEEILKDVFLVFGGMLITLVGFAMEECWKNFIRFNMGLSKDMSRNLAMRLNNLLATAPLYGDTFIRDKHHKVFSDDDFVHAQNRLSNELKNKFKSLHNEANKAVADTLSKREDKTAEGMWKLSYEHNSYLLMELSNIIAELHEAGHNNYIVEDLELKADAVRNAATYAYNTMKFFDFHYNRPNIIGTVHTKKELEAIKNPRINDVVGLEITKNDIHKMVWIGDRWIDCDEIPFLDIVEEDAQNE